MDYFVPLSSIFLPSIPLSRKIKIKMYQIIILPVRCTGVKFCCLHQGKKIGRGFLRIENR